MTEAPKILLAHRLKTPKLPTLPHGNTTRSPGPRRRPPPIHSARVRARGATEGQDHVRFLARLVEPEPPGGVRRQIMICGRPPGGVRRQIMICGRPPGGVRRQIMICGRPPAGASGGCRRIDHLRAFARKATHQGGEVPGHQEPPSIGLHANQCRATDSFDFKAIPELDKMQVLELARCERTLRRETVIMPEACLRHDALGPSGTGKSHIALGLGLNRMPEGLARRACQKGLSDGFATAATFAMGLGPVAAPWLTQRTDGGAR